MKITFLLPSISQALAFQRAQAMRHHGAQTEVLAFEREAYLTEHWENRYTSLGSVSHRQYGGRPAQLLRALPSVRAAARSTDVLYATSLDMLILGWLATRGMVQPPRLVFDVFDIRDVLTRNGRVSDQLRRLERRILRDVEQLIVTSEAYVTGYYRGVQGLNQLPPYLVIENKLDPQQLIPVAAPRPSDGILRIGYFGKLRCARSWEILQTVAREGNGRVHIQLRGIPRLPGLIEQAQAAPYIHYGGPYVSPRDLSAIYHQVDMVWAIYQFSPEEVGNWRWARTHRFYESCYFQRPMFTQTYTEDGRVAEWAGLGPVLDLRDIRGSVQRILRITASDLTRWQHNIEALPQHVHTQGDEYARLYAALSGRACPKMASATPAANLR